MLLLSVLTLATRMTVAEYMNVVASPMLLSTTGESQNKVRDGSHIPMLTLE